VYDKEIDAYQKKLVEYGRAMVQHNCNCAKRKEYLRLKEEYDTKKKVCGWLYDKWLGASCVSGEKHFGLQVRPYNYPDAKVLVDGKERVCITKATQAFGLVMCQNCHKRWENGFKFKAIPGNARVHVPAHHKDKADTFKYKAKWSDNQGQGSGWDPEAYKVFNQRVQEVTDWRNKEKQSGYKRWKKAQEFCKEINGVPLQQMEPKGELKEDKVEDEDHDESEDETGKESGNGAFHIYCEEEDASTVAAIEDN
jgi:hypothetical protein